MASDLESPGGRGLWAYAELVRLPNIFTALADVAMGYLVARAYAAGDAPLLAALLLASAALYAGGVAMNDLVDRRLDDVERPERPIPSGRVSPRAAARLVAALVALGAAAGGVAALLAGDPRPLAVTAGLIALIALYNLLLKRTPLGPAAMGGCRALNVLLGMSVSVEAWQAHHLLIAAAIGVYIAGVTLFARHETGRASRAILLAGTVVIVGGIALLSRLPRWTDEVVPLLTIEPGRWNLMMAALAILIGWRCLRAVAVPDGDLVRAAVRQCLLSVVVLDAAAAFAIRGVPAAAAICVLLAPALVFQQWFEAT